MSDEEAECLALGGCPRDFVVLATLFLRPVAFSRGNAQEAPRTGQYAES